MKVTEELLLALDAKKQDDGSFKLSCGGVHNTFKPPSDKTPWWDVDGHAVTDLEEVIANNYRDGYRDGQNSLRRDLNELLTKE
jgi:hypothetical protein